MVELIRYKDVVCVCVYVYLHKRRRTEGRTVGENFLYITRIRLSLFTDSMVLYVENLKKSTNTHTQKHDRTNK